MDYCGYGRHHSDSSAVMVCEDCLATLRRTVVAGGRDWPTYKGCPFCGSLRPPVIHEGDEVFLPRRGCADCDRWWEGADLRETRRTK